MMKLRFSPIALAFFAAQIIAWAQPKIQLIDFASGFDRPVDITHCGDSRIFVVEQDGKIWALDSLGNRISNTPFLDIDPRVNSQGNEQGLLGLAFHPNYAQNGLFYVHYTKTGSGSENGDTRVSRFTRDSLDANKADPDSEKILLIEDQPYSNHNGGSLKFGPDGYLYIGLGDGGSGGDPQGYGQKKNTFLGKILRIDVDGGDPYKVPADNPFVNDPAYRPEIWHTGLRNPWRISFDRLTGDLWIGDVGQNAREEIDFQAVGVGGINYGWRCYEGNNTYNTSGCGSASDYTKPVFDYANPSIGCSVTGGFVYRGSQYADLFGVYLHTDYCSGRWWATLRRADGTFTTSQIADLTNNEYSSLGEGLNGDLYVAMLSAGKIQKIKELCSPFQVSGTASDATCPDAADGSIALNIVNPTGNVTVTWSNGANTPDITSLLPGEYRVTVKDGNNCERRDTFNIGNTLPAPAAPDLISLIVQICEGDTNSLQCPEAPSGFGYQWYRNGAAIPDATERDLPVFETGNYQVAFTGQPCNSLLSNGISVNVNPPPAPEITLSNDTLTASVVGFSMQWYLDGTPITGANDPTWVPTETGNYSFSVSNGICEGISAPLFVEVLIGTRLPVEVQTFSVSPNPTKRDFFVEMTLKTAQKIGLRLSDAQDKVLQTKQLEGKKIRQNFDIGQLPAGTYQLTVTLESGSFVRRVIKI